MSGATSSSRYPECDRRSEKAANQDGAKQCRAAGRVGYKDTDVPSPAIDQAPGRTAITGLVCAVRRGGVDEIGIDAVHDKRVHYDK